MSKLIWLYKEYVIMLEGFHNITRFFCCCCYCYLVKYFEVEKYLPFLENLPENLRFLVINLMIVITCAILDLVPDMLSLMERKANEFVEMAKIYENVHNRPQTAIEYYKKAIFISRILGIKKTERVACERLVFIYKRLGNYYKMRDYAEECVRLGKETGDKLFEGCGYLRLGAAISFLGYWKEAISHSRKSVDIAFTVIHSCYLSSPFSIESSRKLNSAQTLVKSAYSNIGTDYSHLGDFHQAKKYLEMDFNLNLKQVLKITLGEWQKAMDLHKHKSGYLRLGAAILGYCKEVILHSWKTLKIALEIVFCCLSSRPEALPFSNIGTDYSYLDDRQDEGTSYMSLAKVYIASGELKKAEDLYHKALDIFRSTGNKLSEGILYANLANIYGAQYYKAIQCLEKGLSIFRQIPNRAREGEIYFLLARVYTSIGKLQESLENLNKSLEMAIETGNKSSEINCYRHLGLVYLNLNKYEEAMKYHEKNLKCAREIGNTYRERIAYFDIGSVHINSGNPEKAIEYFEMSLKNDTPIINAKLDGRAYCGFGEAYFKMKKYHKAITVLEKSLEIAKSIDDKRIEGRTRYQLGLVYYEQSGEESDPGKCQDAKKKSEEMLKEALKCCEWEFTQLKDLNDFKIPLADVFIQVYKMLTKVLIELQKTDEALLVSDRGRARSLGDILVSKYGMNPTQERDPSQTPLDSNGLDSVLSDQCCILFFNMEHAGGIHAWVLTHQQPKVFVNISNKASTAFEVLKKFYHKIDEMEANTDPVVESQNVTDQKTDELEVLFSLLITPVMEHLQHEEIVIIPDGQLFMVPFAALRDPTTGKYLSETKSIRISPSLATLKALQEITGEHHSKTDALVVGHPDVGKVMYKGETKEFDRLFSSKGEAESIARILNATPLTGSQATKEMVKQKLREGVAVIHIAAHGDSEHGHIILAPPPRRDTTSIPEEQDYMLTMQEVQEIGVTAQLVVLSCCYSGRGDIKAEGVVGMSRAFLAAGARAVVASLWPLDDYASSRFMPSFYASLKMGESASKSLQNAMDDIREEEDPEDPRHWDPSLQKIKDYSEPKYWAPLFLIGDDVTISV